MSPMATQRIRRATALLAVLWAASALVLAIYGQLSSERSVDPPIQTSALSGVALVSWCSDVAIQAGVKEGDRVLYAKYAGTEIKLEGDKKVLILRESDVLALVK